MGCMCINCPGALVLKKGRKVATSPTVWKLMGSARSGSYFQITPLECHLFIVSLGYTEISTYQIGIVYA